MRILVKVFLLLLLLLAGNAMANTCTAKSGTNNWSSASPWSGCGVPDDGDTVTIPSAGTVTLNVDCQKIARL